jgi:hypothetical protein
VEKPVEKPVEILWKPVENFSKTCSKKFSTGFPQDIHRAKMTQNKLSLIYRIDYPVDFLWKSPG